MRRTVATTLWTVCLFSTLNFQLSTVSGQAVAPIVSGPAAEGSAPVRNPLWVAGKGADGNIHSVRTANDGTVRTDPSGTTTQPVSIASLAQLPVALDGSGYLKVHEQGTVPVTGTFWQATQPVSGTFWQATQPVSGTFWQATQPVSGTFWQATQPVSGTVTANIGTSGSLALDASVTGLQVAQGSTTSGQSGPLLQGAVTTSVPSYTTAKTNPLSLDTSGNLRVTLSGALPGDINVSKINGVLPLMGNGVTGTGSQRVTIASDNTAFTVNAAESGTWNVGLSTGSNTIGKIDILGNAGAILDFAGQNAAQPSNAILIGGEFNTTPTTITNGNASPLQLDNAGNLLVNIKAGASGNSAASATGSSVPASADYNGINVAGTLRGQTGVNPSGSIYAGQADVASVAGTTVDTNSGNKSAGTQRVVLATDQPALTNKLLVTPDSVALPANQSVNVNQIGGSSVSTIAAGVQKVGIVDTAGNSYSSSAGGVMDTNTRFLGSNGVSTTASGVQRVGASGIYRKNFLAGNPSDGANFDIAVDPEANLLTSPGQAVVTLGAWTSATGLNATQLVYGPASSLGVGGSPEILVHLVQTTTLTAGAITFEVSYDNTNWVTIPADAVVDPSSTSLAQISLPYTVQASTNKPFLIVNRGWQALRIKLPTQITGTGSVTPNVLTVPNANYVHMDQDYVAGSAIATVAAGVQKVAIVDSTGASFNSSAGGVMDTNTRFVGGNGVATAGSGIQKVGIVGNSGGATLDSTIGAATAPANALAVSNVYQTTVPALTAGQAVAMQGDTTGSLYVNTTGRSASYRMAVKSFTPVASATSPTFSIQGSATKTVRIMRIVVTTQALTGTGTPFKSDLVLQKYSALTGGTTGSTPTGTLMDGNNAAQTAVCLQYSAVPTTATAIGGLVAAELIQQITASATANGTTRNEFTFGDKGAQGLVLRGTAQYLGITINPLGTTPLMSLWIEWVEDNS